MSELLPFVFQARPFGMFFAQYLAKLMELEAWDIDSPEPEQRWWFAFVLARE